MSVPEILGRLMKRQPMTDAELLFLLAEIDQGRVTPVQVAGLLTALHMLAK